MMRRFNVTGICVPEKNYMVDISGKIDKIRKLVDDQCYFTINRARQYGKSTTLSCLERELRDDYLVVSVSFEGLGIVSFESEANFCRAFLAIIRKALRFSDVSEDCKKGWSDPNVASFLDLSEHITNMCEPAPEDPGSPAHRERKVVLMVDEVDATSNNRVFIRFLAMLRSKFLARQNNKDYTFHSIILAGVYDIRNIKLKIAGEGADGLVHEEQRMYNSPWNIAVKFDVDMSFSPAEIATMLIQYESDHGTGMDITAVSDEIHSYTSGYPFLVSRICQCIDEELDKDWTLSGIQNAVLVIHKEKNTLFDDLIKNLENNKALYDFMYDLLFVGIESKFIIHDTLINLGHMYGFIREDERNKAKVTNRIFEVVLYDYFLSKNFTSKKQASMVLQNDIVKNGRFDMELCLVKFAEHYAHLWNERDAEFIEREGRLLFLSYLSPLINGHGFYHIESQLTDMRRMDVVVDFGREQFIIELKLWRGEAVHEKAYEQLHGYMGSRGAKIGYLLTFDFRNNARKQPYAKWIEYEGTRIFDVVT